MTAAKVMDVIARLPNRHGQAADAVSACTQVKLEDAPRLLNIPKPEYPYFLNETCMVIPSISWIVMGVVPHPWGPGRVLGSSEPTPEGPLRGRGAQGGSGSSPPNWIPNSGVQGEPCTRRCDEHYYIRLGRRAACRDRRHLRHRERASLGPSCHL